MLFPLLFVTVLAIVVGSVVKAPYAMLSPGSARPIQPLLSLGTDKTFDHPGELLFVTVSVNAPPSEPNYMWALYGWLDPDRVVYPAQVVTDGRSGKDEERYQAVLMDASQRSAAYLALKHLGYPVQQTARGAFLSTIVKGSPADGKLHAGDTVVDIGGSGVNNSSDVGTILRQHRVGDTVDITVERPQVGKVHVALTLGSQVDQTGTKVPYLGVYLETRIEYRLPFSVNIDTGKIGGPSAGLAFTLAIIDRLSKSDITNGHKVAVTGTMEPDGKVGDVGGVAQKTVAVRRSGADVFLVPPGEYDEAVAHAGKHLKVIKVSTLDEALKVLAALPKKAPK